MGANSHIQWTDHTFNPWMGCTKVSTGCINCYAAVSTPVRVLNSQGRTLWGKGARRERTSIHNWNEPIRWNKEEDGKMVSHAEFVANRRPRVFCASLADWLDDEVPIEWLADLLNLIRLTPNLDWQLLTKRPENFKQRLIDAVGLIGIDYWVYEWIGGKAPANVWIGTTVEDQTRANERIPALLRIPARIRFLSCEPLLGPVHIHTGVKRPEGYRGYFDWVICGGESGPGARPMLVEWADDLRRQCANAGVPFFMKQLGAHVGTTNANAHDWPEHVEFEEVAGTPQFAGARVILRHKKGGDFDEFPTELQVRQFPGGLS